MSYQQQAQKYFEYGFDVLPEFKGSGASIKGWNTIDITQELINKQNFESLAIRLNQEVIAIDVDTDDPVLQEQIREILPKGAPEKFGTKGFTMFFKTKTPLKSENFKLNGKTVIELLSAGRKTSVGLHRSTGKPYQWPKPLCHVGKLTYITKRHLEALRIAFPKPIYTPTTYQIDYTPDIKEIEEAISHIPSHDRDTWIDVGRSLYSFDPNAFALFDKWSSTCTTYKQKDCQIVWKSFANTTSTTIATLFWYAKQNGYIRKQKEDSLDYLNRYCPMFDDVKAGDTINSSYEFTPPPSLLLDIAEWITDTAPRKQPILSLSASICFVGMLLAHRVQSPTGLRSNIYTVSVAHSGTGKEHPRSCVADLMALADMSGAMAEKPTAGTAMVNSLQIGKSKCLYQIDEFGIFYQNVANSKGQSAHMVEIKSNILSLFSSANKSFVGKSFSSGASGKLVPPTVINQPCMCIHGSTTHDSFFSALGSGDTVDGFLNRFLIFKSDETKPKRQRIAAVHKVPDFIQEQIMSILSENPEVPIVMQYSQEADEIFQKFEKKIEDKIDKGARDGTAEAWVRCEELAIKLALICSAGDTEINAKAAQWGCDLSFWNSQQLIDIAENKIYDNEHHKTRNSIIEFVKKKNIVSHSAMMKHFNRKIKGREFKEFIHDLCESGVITMCNKDGKPPLGNEARYYLYSD